jgi:hypothetical protein
MQVEDGHVDVVEQLAVVVDRLARREEDDDLLALVLLEEGEEEEEAPVRLADDVALLERRDGRGRRVGDDVDEERAGPERDAGEVGNLGRLRGREEHRLPVLLWEEGNDLLHLLLETNLEDAVSLINDERLDILKDEALRVLSKQQGRVRRERSVSDQIAAAG